MNTDFLLDLGDWILLSSAPALVLFVGFYYFGSPWKKLLVGRSLMYFAMSLLAIIFIVILSLFLGTGYPGREWIRIIGYGLVSVTTWRLFITLRYIQKNPPVMPEEVIWSDDEILAKAAEIIARRNAGSLERESDEAL
jgi:hypothetical protein